MAVDDLHFIPISALKGDNIVTPSDTMPWYQGSTLMHMLETVHIASDRNLIDFRFPVQFVESAAFGFSGVRGHDRLRHRAGRATRSWCCPPARNPASNRS